MAEEAPTPAPTPGPPPGAAGDYNMDLAAQIAADVANAPDPASAVNGGVPPPVVPAAPPPVEEPPPSADAAPEVEPEQAAETPEEEQAAAPEQTEEERKAEEESIAAALAEIPEEPDEKIQFPWEDEAPTEVGETDAEKAAAEAFKQEYLKEAPNPDHLLALFTKTNRGKRVYESGFKLVREADKPESEGGLGGMPALDEIKDWRTSHQDFERMLGDFSSGDPERTSAAIAYWFGPNEQGQVRPGAEIAIKQLPAVLAGDEKTLPLFLDLETRILSNRMELAYDRGYKATSDGDRNREFGLARAIEYSLKGTWRRLPGEDADSGGYDPAEQQAPQRDPRVDREIAARDEKIKTLEQRQLDSFDADIEHEFGSILQQGAEAALHDLKPYLGAAYDSVVKDFGGQVDGIIDQDPSFHREMGELVRRAYDSGSTDDRQKVIEKYRRNIGYSIRQHAMKFRQNLRSNGTQRGTDIEAQRAKLEAAQNLTSPTGQGGPPASPQASPKLERQPNESEFDLLQRQIIQDTQGPIASP